MTWCVEFDEAARKDLLGIDGPSVTEFLRDRVAVMEDPRIIGDALKGSRMGEFWMYTVLDYKIISIVEDTALRILVLRVAHRRRLGLLRPGPG